MTNEKIFDLYYDNTPELIKTIDVCRGESDFRKVYITDDGKVKLAIKHTSNIFTNTERILAWAHLNDEYNKLGIYCPVIISNRNGKRFLNTPKTDAFSIFIQKNSRSMI